MRFVRDRLWRRSRDGTGLLAGSPPTWWTVTDAGARVLDALERGTELPEGHGVLTERLVDGGAIHPEPGDDPPAHDVTVVVPVFARDSRDVARAAAVVTRLAPLRVVVVDDASPVAVRVPRADTIRLAANAGPGGARNAGLAQVRTPLVAFVDVDVRVDAGRVLRLASHLSDPRTAIVAPRVTASPGTRFSDYETARSPLDLGAQSALVRPFSRVSHVPAAVIVCRREQLCELGGFDSSLRWGEDVDLVWRAARTGLRVRYEPGVIVEHEPRETLRDLLAQRFRYGSSAGPLARRHGATVAPWRGSAAVAVATVLWLSASWLPALVATSGVATWYSFALARRGLSLFDAGRTAVAAQWHALFQACSAVVRAWWPVLAVAAPWSWRAWFTVAASVAVTTAGDVLRHRELRSPRAVVLRLADDVAYSLGLWRGAVAARSARCLLPAISSPRRRAS